MVWVFSYAWRNVDRNDQKHCMKSNEDLQRSKQLIVSWIGGDAEPLLQPAIACRIEIEPIHFQRK